jgi:soluble lytic murein transglycosylase-like protein
LGRLTKLAALAGLLACAAPGRASPVDRWASEIREAARRFKIPEEWIARVMRVESGGLAMLEGKPITSASGAMGLMQVMPGTWSEMRRTFGLGDDPYQPRDNVLAGAAYLRAMYDRFGYPGLFAAYNAGPSRFKQSLNSGRRLPPETRAYVSKVIGRPVLAKHTARKTRAHSMLFAIERDLGSGHAPALSEPNSLFAIRP